MMCKLVHVFSLVSLHFFFLPFLFFYMKWHTLQLLCLAIEQELDGHQVKKVVGALVILAAKGRDFVHLGGTIPQCQQNVASEQETKS